MGKINKNLWSNHLSIYQISTFMKLSDEEKLEVASGFVEFVKAVQTPKDEFAFVTLKRS